MAMNSAEPEQGLQAGDRAPDFELPDADMAIVRMDDFRGRRHLVLFFYIRDHTPACTTEAIEFSDLEAEFERLNCAVLGVSRDDCISHGEFRDQQGIGVRLLADREHGLSRAYHVLQGRLVEGVRREIGLRSTFVIDRAGQIRHAFYGVTAKGHAAEILNLVKEMESSC